MRIPPFSWLALGGALALAWGGLLPQLAPLAAAGTGVTALMDFDGDGLDDALEMRLGTNTGAADSDGDQVSDLEELLRGSDPLVFGTQSSMPAPTSQIRLEVYQVGTDFVLQVFALRQLGVSDFRLYRVLTWGIKTFTYSSLVNQLVDLVSSPAHAPGWTIDRMRLRIPSSWFDSHPSTSFVVEGLVDGLRLADQVILTHAGTEVAEAYTVLASQTGSAPHSPASLAILGAPSESSSAGVGSSGGLGSGMVGLSPVEPVGEIPPPSRGTPDEVCLQLLAPTAVLGSGRIEYTVVDANCSPSPGSLCLSGCSLTVGDTLIAIDVVGLLGG